VVGLMLQCKGTTLVFVSISRLVSDRYGLQITLTLVEQVRTHLVSGNPLYIWMFTNPDI